MQIELIPAQASDAEQLALLRIAAMRESLMRIGRFDLQRARDRFLSTFSPNDTRYIMVDRVRVGFVVMKPTEAGCLLDHLYVLPGHQNGGIGSWVLRQLFAEADRQRHDIRVGALKESTANEFYLRHGFVLVETTEWDNYYVRLSTNPR